MICKGGYYEFNGQKLQTSGVYRDTFTAVNGCDSIVILDLITLPEQDLQLAMTADAGFCVGDSVEFVGSGSKHYHWYVNGSSLGNGDTKLLRLHDKHNEIVIVATSENNCVDTLIKIVPADPCCDMFVPNVFSPNNDGVNDLFGPIPYGHISVFKMEIFNRWGQLVFASFDISKHWDGTYHSKPAQGEVYFYVITASCMGEEELIRKGDVTLIR